MHLGRTEPNTYLISDEKPFERLGVKSSICMDQLAARVVGERGEGGAADSTAKK